jgi:hypothetical protein
MPDTADRSESSPLNRGCGIRHLSSFRVRSFYYFSGAGPTFLPSWVIRVSNRARAFFQLA